MGPPLLPQSLSSSNKKDDRVNVFLRLRPMNKLETLKRSKNCVELHDDPSVITVDSPLQGMFDFSFDMVFDEYASQEEVYKESVSMIPNKLLDGINCTVIAYGQTGTGKTHTMLGEGHGIEMTVRARQEFQINSAKRQEGEREEEKEKDAENGGYANVKLDPKEQPHLTEGLIPRVVADLFQKINQDSRRDVEYTIRCSFVEMYLEKLVDLIQPSTEEVIIGEDARGDACIVGASELCCVNIHDVYSILARGNAYRTKSATDQNCDSSRSHAIFSIRIDQYHRKTGMQCSSRLQMLDLAGSELGKSKSSRAGESRLAQEAKMINASLASVIASVRSHLAKEGKDKFRINPRSSLPNWSKLARLLQPCLGGNNFTTLMCTASPSSYNITESLATIQFGQKFREINNKPHKNEYLSYEGFSRKIFNLEKRNHNLTQLVKLLAQECKALQQQKSQQPQNQKLWNIIQRLEDVENFDDMKITVTIQRKDEPDPVQDLEQKMIEHEAKEKFAIVAREKAESALRDRQSEVTSLRSQNEVLNRDRERLEHELNEAKGEIRMFAVRKTELENNLRTSQFREDEAITFLRQFRSFYLRLLKNKAAQGSGDTRQIAEDVSKKIPGVPNLTDLLDVDRLLVESGIIEQDEIGKDTNSAMYVPSKDALSLSADQVKQSEERERRILVQAKDENKNTTNGDVFPDNLSIKRLQEQSNFAEYRQRLLQTPAGKLAISREKELEKELADLPQKCAALQNSLNSERAMVEALSARQGALSKIKQAQEMNILRQDLERKSNDLQAIVWKMNELHLVNTAIDVKVDKREHRAVYLEEQLFDLQGRNIRLESERQEMEKKLHEEIVVLKDRLDGLGVKLWQLGDANIPASRLIIPCGGIEPSPIEQEWRLSLSDEDFELLADEETPNAFISDSCQTEDSENGLKVTSTAEISTQTEPAEMSNMSIQTDHAEASNISVQTDECPKVDFKSMETQTEELIVLDAEVQTEETAVLDAEIQTNEKTHSNAEIQTDEKTSMDVEIQTEESEKPELIESSTQTSVERMSDAGIQTDGCTNCNVEVQTEGEFSRKAETLETSVQTEEEFPKNAESSDIGVQTMEEFPEKADIMEAWTQTEEAFPEKPLTYDVVVQSEEAMRLHSFSAEAGIQTDDTAKPDIESIDTATQTESDEQHDKVIEKEEIENRPPLTEISTQTEDVEFMMPKAKVSTIGVQTNLDPVKICMEVETQTDELPREIALKINKALDGDNSACDSSSARNDQGDFLPYLLDTKKVRKASNHSDFDASISEGSLASLTSKNEKPMAPFERLNQSTDSIIATQKNVDWRSRRRPKTKDEYEVADVSSSTEGVMSLKAGKDGVIPLKDPASARLSRSQRSTSPGPLTMRSRSPFSGRSDSPVAGRSKSPGPLFGRPISPGPLYGRTKDQPQSPESSTTRRAGRKSSDTKDSKPKDLDEPKWKTKLKAASSENLGASMPSISYAFNNNSTRSSSEARKSAGSIESSEKKKSSKKKSTHDKDDLSQPEFIHMAEQLRKKVEGQGWDSSRDLRSPSPPKSRGIKPSKKNSLEKLQTPSSRNFSSDKSDKSSKSSTKNDGRRSDANSGTSEWIQKVRQMSQQRDEDSRGGEEGVKTSDRSGKKSEKTSKKTFKF